jgi:thioredoxin-dependent peroxiredoxin
MVDPPKATKGRRMSKKTRRKTGNKAGKKPSGSPAVKPTRAQTAAAAKTPPAKTRPAATKTVKKPTAKPGDANRPAGKSPGGKATASTSRHQGLAEGAKAPAFRLPRDGGGSVSLADYAGRKLVLFFYPRADTPGCTREAIDFTRLADAFAQSRTAVLGVSADPVKAQESFRNKHQLAIPLLSDEEHAMLEAYGVWGEKSMYGKTFQGIVRTTVLIGPDGLVRRIWRHVKVDGHADSVLEAARAF